MDISENIFSKSISDHADALHRFKKTGFPVIRGIVGFLTDCFDGGGKVLLAGNGGSAADCQHIAGELVGRFKKKRPPMPAISLASDTSVLTCIANDYDYDLLFSRQVKALGESRDVLWALSTSGASANIVKAAEEARAKGLVVIAFTGKKDSPLEERSDVCLCADTDDTAHAQEIHQLAYHIICRYLDEINTG